MLNNILLMAPSNGQQGGSTQFFITMLLIVVVFYFFMIRPQTKKAKDEKNFREGLKKGDKIITLGGIHGRITDVAEKTFTIEIESGTRMKIEKSAISADLSKQFQQEATTTTAA